MSTKELVIFLVSQGLAVVLVVTTLAWIFKIGLPFFFKGFMRRMDENTQAIDVLSAIVLVFMEGRIPQDEFDEKMDMLMRMKNRDTTRRINGHEEGKK